MKMNWPQSGTVVAQDFIDPPMTPIDADVFKHEGREIVTILASDSCIHFKKMIAGV